MSALELNPRRLGLLMRNDLSGARTAGIMLAAASGTIFILYVLTSIGGGSVEFHRVVYPLTLIVLGYILSSFTFSEIHETRTGAFALTSPGSLLEKYVSKVLLTSVGWALAFTLSYVATTALGAAASGLLFHSSHGVFLPTRGWMWQAFAGYLVSQSLFVLGSIYFKKAAFLKTVLAATVIAITFAVLFLFVWRAVYWDAFARFMPTEAEMNAVMEFNTPAAERLVGVFGKIGDIARWTVVPVFTWVVGYLRLRETEV